MYINIQGHPELNKSGRKRLCRVLDCKKLSIEACTHAAQNELLPLRVVVQVLFFEQARAAVATGQVINLPSNIKALVAEQDDPSRLIDSLLGNKTLPPYDQWSVSGLKTPNSSFSTLKMELAENDQLNKYYGDKTGKSSQVKENRSAPSRPRGMFSRLWTINRHASGKN